MTPLRIGTRGSRLALWQANHVADALRPLAAPRSVELIEIQTVGDQVRDRPLAQLGGIGVFTKEIQRAVLAGAVDVAVHSLKDLPTLPVEGLTLAAVPPRAAAGDVFISHRHPRFEALPVGATVATGSLRRRAQVLHRRPDLRMVDIRGNVDTRLRRLDEENLDALILAQAGLERLGLGAAITHVLDPAWMLPAVGQGALGLECRADDAVTLSLLRSLDDPATRQAVTAERSLLFALGGGCLVPIGAAATVTADGLTLRAAVLAPDGRRRVEGEVHGPANEAETLGKRLAEDLLGQGARELLGLEGGRDLQQEGTAMNKVGLVIGLLVLAVSLVNTFLLLQMGAKLQHAADKIEPVARDMQQLQQLLEKVPKPPEPPLPKPPLPGESNNRKAKQEERAAEANGDGGIRSCPTPGPSAKSE